MKGIPTKDGFYIKRQPGHPNMCVELWTKGKTYRFMEGYLITGREREFVDAEFIPIPPPPNDGKEYACVWVEVKRDVDGNRMCMGCTIPPHCPDDWPESIPGPDCPLRSD